MKMIHKVLTGAVAVAGLATIAPSATAGGAAVLADGRVHAYSGTYKSGTHCSWVGSDDDWSTCNGGDMLNRASSLYNTGYAGGNDDVNFYYIRGYRGAWACLGRGDYWAALNLNREHFSWGGSDAGGYGRPVNDRVESHKWVSYCGKA